MSEETKEETRKEEETKEEKQIRIRKYLSELDDEDKSIALEILTEKDNLQEMIKKKFSPAEILSMSLSSTKQKDLDLFICNDVIPMIREKSSVNFFDNYKFRTIQILDLMNKQWSNFELSKERHGPDARTTKTEVSGLLLLPELKNIEIKSKLCDNKGKICFEFDKQNDENRRVNTLLYDGFIFSMIYQERTRIILKGTDKNTVDNINKILKKEQDKFVLKLEAKKDGEKLGRDSIQLSLEEMLQTESQWNLCIDGNWKLDVKSEGCLLEINKFDNEWRKKKSEDYKKDDVVIVKKDAKKGKQCSVCKEFGHIKSNKICPMFKK